MEHTWIQSALTSANAVHALALAVEHGSEISPADKHELATGLDIEPATDIHYLLHSHETYLGLVISAGWTMEEYRAWLYLTLCEQLLTPRSRQDIIDAARGMSFHPSLRTWSTKPAGAKALSRFSPKA